ncbi:hypothetical protein NSP77_26005, partial [Salmonella enterica]|nr:hypothetical protein [Salmonella enterica]
AETGLMAGRHEVRKLPQLNHRHRPSSVIFSKNINSICHKYKNIVPSKHYFVFRYGDIHFLSNADTKLNCYCLVLLVGDER